MAGVMAGMRRVHAECASRRNPLAGKTLDERLTLLHQQRVSAHPDRGGSGDTFIAAQRRYDELAARQQAIAGTPRPQAPATRGRAIERTEDSK